MSNEHVVPALTRSETPPVEGSPGAVIREARTKARMSVEELAAVTKLAKHTLEALEKDDFNALQEAVYVRGYYRKCAKILGLNEKQLVDAYNGRVVPKRPDPPSKLRLASGTEIGEANPLPIPMAVGSAVGAVVIGILLWNLFKSPDEPEQIPVSTQNVIVEPQASAPLAADATGTATAPVAPTPGTDVVPAAPAAATGTPAVAPAAPADSAATPAPALTAPTATAAQAAVPPPPPKPAAPEVPPKSMALNFTGTSWARVEDASGKILLNGLMREGENRTLRGPPPFTVFLGNGPGVKVEFEGQAVDFTSRVSDNLTARFTVP